MPKAMPRKAKQNISKPLPDPMTSVTQEKNGVKRKLTSTAKKPNVLAPKRFANSTITKDNSDDTEVVKESAPTTVSNETISEIKSLEKPSPYTNSMAKPKHLSLDPVELQSITKLQNWCPSIRNSSKESKTETNITKTISSQCEILNRPKPEIETMKLTQYKPVVWNPPLRRNMSPAVTSATPSKRAKICDADIKPARSADEESKAEIDIAIEGKDYKSTNSKQTQEQAEFENASTVENTASLVASTQGKNSGKVGFNGESFDAHESSAEKMEIDETLISYSPTTVPLVDQQEGCQKESSQNSEEDMFLSHEPTEVLTTGIQPEFPSEDVTEVSVAKADQNEDPRSQEHFNTVVSDSAKKPNSVGGISKQSVDQSHELSDEDIFETENRKEDTFNNSHTSKVSILKTASQQSHDGVLEEIKVDQENADVDMFYSDEEIVSSINVEKSHCEPPNPEPSINGVADNSESDVMKTPTSQGVDHDFYLCKTVKRVCTEITQASTEVPEAPEVTAIDSNDVYIANNSTRDEETQSAVNVHAAIESSLPDASAIRNVDLDLSCGTLEPTKGISEELAPNAGANDEVGLIVGNEAKSINLAAASGEINTENISVNTPVNGEEPKEVEDENLEAEGIRLKPGSDFVVDDNKIDAPIAVDDSQKEADVPRASASTETEVKESDKPVGFPPSETANGQTNSEMQELELKRASADAEIKLTENEKELAANDVDALSQKGNIEDRRTCGEPGVQNECKDIFSQTEEQEPQPLKAIDKESSPKVDSTKSGFKKAERCEMKPYKYEMDQDFDISQSQLIEIESAIMRECQVPGRGGMPRMAEAAPGFVPGTCGEARVPGFMMPSLPPAPALNWKKKVQEDRQKLRAAIHQLSRLNAMLISVRREFWPTTGTNPEAPLPTDINRPGPSGRRY